MADAPGDQKKPAAPAGTQQLRVRWDTSDVKSSYSNVCNVTSTREEVVLNFGINQSWERSPGEIEIKLTHRIILSPFAAKRLAATLSKLMAEYEARYGEMRLEPTPPGGDVMKQ
ncbi:MAG: hypothetical protein Kow0092_39800 [Deferrisomatales bacterium]